MATTITHIIFDMDGTVVDSESLLFEAIDRICVTFGRTATFEVKQKLLGHPFKERALQLYSDLRFEEVLNFKSFVSQLISDCRINVTMNGIKLMPGIERVVQYLRQNKIPMAIATGNDSKSYEETAQRFSPFFDNFSHAVLSGDKREHIPPKPSPDIYIKAFERFSPQPESFDNVLVFEDSEVGVLAAITARMKCIYVCDSRINNRKESKIATQVISSFNQFIPEEFGLPPMSEHN